MEYKPNTSKTGYLQGEGGQVKRRMQAQEGPLQPTASSQRKEPEGQRPDSFPRAQGPQRRPKGLR